MHLLGLEQLSRQQIQGLLDAADGFMGVGRKTPKLGDLNGTVVANLFYEASTRTRLSFTLAARRVGAETLDFSPGGSSTAKGESFVDTARNIVAMGVDAVVVRHSSSGAPHLLADHLNRDRKPGEKEVAVVNAGDGAHEHPTQGLLDMLTIRQRKGRLDGLTVALVGDILHSRVARSNMHGLIKMGAKVIACGPPTLVPPEVGQFGVEIAHDLDAILPRCDVVNLLRVQFERQRSAFFPSVGEYAHVFGMTGERLRRAKEKVLILAPGPINRGVEITPEVADGPNSAILEQVTNGVAVRMAVLKWACPKVEATAA